MNIQTYNDLPVLKVVVDESKEQGIDMISLVDYPAIESNFILLNKDSSEIILSKINNYEQILTGASLIPDKLILRNNPINGDKFYIVYDADTIKMAVNKFFKNGLTSNINLQHNSAPIEGNYLIESWFIDDFETDKAKTLGFEKLPKGTWMTSIKISNEKFWNDEVMSGNVKGFSIEMNGGLKFNSIQNIQNIQNIQKYEIKTYESSIITTLDELSDGEYETTSGEIIIVKNHELIETIKLSDIIELENSLIELATVPANRIRNVMDSKRVVKIYYEGSFDGNETITAGFRSIEIFCYGLTLRANRAIRAWQRAGSSDRGEPEGWKLFLTEKITSFDNTIQKYDGNRPNYNPNDKGMITIFQSI